MPISWGSSFPFSAPTVSIFSLSVIFPSFIARYGTGIFSPSLSPFTIYPRPVVRVDMIWAYVAGRPIPSSSSFLTSEASEYLDGGAVKRPPEVNPSGIITSPSLSAGRITSSSSCWSSELSIYTLRNPSNNTCAACTANFSSLLSLDIFMSVRRILASAICEAIVLFQMRLYNFCSWAVPSMEVLAIYVGLIASWASWAPLE